MDPSQTVPDRQDLPNARGKVAISVKMEVFRVGTFFENNARLSDSLTGQASFMGEVREGDHNVVVIIHCPQSPTTAVIEPADIVTFTLVKITEILSGQMRIFSATSVSLPDLLEEKE